MCLRPWTTLFTGCLCSHCIIGLVVVLIQKNLQKMNKFIDYYIYWRPLLPLHHSLVIAIGILDQIEDLILHAYT